MTPKALGAVYRAYLACLNTRDWDRLGNFVDAEVHRNGERLGVEGYRAMLERDVSDIPDLRFEIGLLVCEPPHVAARLLFDCRPRGRFLGVDVNGRRVRFAENVFYGFRSERIASVWSLIDRAGIEAQLTS